PMTLSLDKSMPLSSVNENSKYNSSGSIVINTNKKPGPPPGRKTSGAIDVIGGTGSNSIVMTPLLSSRGDSNRVTPPPREDRMPVHPPLLGPQLKPMPLQGPPNSNATNENNFISVIGQRPGA